MNIDDILDQLQPDSGLTGQTDFVMAKADVEQLKQVWINERMSPELLQFESELLDRMMERVRDQMEFIEQNTVELQGTDIKVKLLIVESELERIKYLIRGYLRIRLAKIDKYAMFIAQDDNQLARLSEKESEYLTKHSEILHSLYKAQFLSSLPENLQGISDTTGEISMVEEPDLERAVFVKVVHSVPELVTAGSDKIELGVGNIYALRYNVIAPYIKTGDVQIV